MKYGLSVILAGVLVLSSGCAAISNKVTEIVGNDLERTGEIAAKYGKPEVKKCVDFLLASLKSEDSTQAKLNELLKEDTKGIASAALKAAILADMVEELRSGANKAAFEKSFQENCNAVSGAIMLNVLRGAKMAATRGQG